jgi:hypothetical protein
MPPKSVGGRDVGEDSNDAPRRVVIVDNDPSTRLGTAAMLRGVPGINLSAAVDHSVALSWRDEWDAVDVAVVDGGNVAEAHDQFPGVAVVESIRAARGRRAPVVVVLTSQFLHPGLRQRMWEAGADFFYPRNEGLTAGQLVAMVVHPEERRSMEATEIALPAELGVNRATRVNEVLARMNDPEIIRALNEGAKKVDPHGQRSRWWDRVRREAGGSHGLTPTKANGDVAQDQDTPSITQLRKFRAAMTKAWGRNHE